MANRLPVIVIGETDPPQLQSSNVRHEKFTKKAEAFCGSFLKSVFFCTVAFVIIVFFPNILLHCDVSFSVESISVSSLSSAATMWYVDFLVNHPSSRCLVNYDEDGVYAKLGFSKNAAVLKTSHTRLSRDHTSFSVGLATEGNQTDVPRVFQVDMKLSARKKVHFVGGDDYGHFYITCENLTLGYDKMKCQSSFKKLKELNRWF